MDRRTSHVFDVLFIFSGFLWRAKTVDHVKSEWENTLDTAAVMRRFLWSC